MPTVSSSFVRHPISKSVTAGGSQTVDRALLVLMAITGENKPLSLDEVSERVQLHRSVVYRLIRSLENAGFVVRDPILGGYTVGASLLSLSVLVSSRLDVRRLARPAMEQMVRGFGETVSLHIKSGDARVCVEVVEGTHEVRRVIQVGETLPIFAGETGRILLAGMNEVELEHQLDSAERNGENRAELHRDVMLARQQGWIIGIGMRTPGVGSLSLPVFGSSGMIGALTTSGPATRWSAAAMQAALPSILEIARSIGGTFATRAA